MKSYTSVQEMVKDIFPEKMARRIVEYINVRSNSKELQVRRVKLNYTELEMASLLKWSNKTLIRVEHATNKALLGKYRNLYNIYLEKLSELEACI